ncbi:MAG: Serine/threonine-protein kinase pkn3 [Gemmataceae bacterium]|nr:Serine/threonine-protein kinase pkn3 [Gemmataceae bacterium]
MPEISACPDPDLLRRHLLGELTDAELSALAPHIEGCDRCVELLGRLRGSDLLTDTVRGQAQTGGRDDPLTEEVISRATRLRPAGDGPPTKTFTTDTAAGTLPDAPARLGRYRVVRRLGSGGMGVVYLAEDEDLRRAVALKVMKPEMARNPAARHRFLREGRAAAGLRHDHVVTVYHVGEETTPDGPTPFLVMELLDGESLETALGRGPLPPVEAARIGREAAEGLAAAHARGVIHRDVKPDNIWLEGARRRVKLLDFGLARAAEVGPGGPTETGLVLGTPGYLSPEQAAGRPLDSRADLFSLGVVLYRALTGRLPFAGKDVMATLTALAVEPAVPVRRANPAVPPELAAVVDQLLAKDPGRRPESAREAADQLAAFERPAAPTRRRNRRPLRAAVAALLLAAVVTVVVVVVKTPTGTVEVETDDPKVRIVVEDGGGRITVIDPESNQQSVTLAEGTYRVLLAGGKDLALETDTFTLSRGGKQVVRVKRRPGPEPDERFRAWAARVAALPPADQAREVAAELKRRNPGFNGDYKHRAAGTTVVEFEFPAEMVTDISPLAALTGLKILSCTGGPAGRGLADIGPLRGLKLESLDLYRTSVVDLSPLKGMPLRWLGLHDTPVTDLSPLKGMPLQTLVLGGGPVADLSPLKEIPLVQLYVHDSAVSDLSPLAGMPLKLLHTQGSAVRDLSPLRGLNLAELVCDFNPWRDTDLVRSFPGLRRINRKPAAEFWGEQDGKRRAFADWAAEVGRMTADEQARAVGVQLRKLNPGAGDPGTPTIVDDKVVGWAGPTTLTDLSPLRAFPHLKSLRLTAAHAPGRLTDLWPLRDLALEELAVDHTPVTDLRPLATLKGLTKLSLIGCPADDLSPLKRLPLVAELNLSRVRDEDKPLLRGIPTLRTINGRPAAGTLR